MTSTDTTNKPFKIEKRQVYEAYKAVRSNHGAAGVDGQTLEMFERDLAENLYKIWNRMSGCVAELVEIGVAASPAERGYLFRQQGQCIEGLALLPTFAIRPLCAW